MKAFTDASLTIKLVWVLLQVGVFICGAFAILFWEDSRYFWTIVFILLGFVHAVMAGIFLHGKKG